ncbi:hypothetical protein IAD21_04089 [Abditibacteriota bacterium]|nr:hypothetical protein IAD21_04089 [Abditibacteriota bacterium]
MEQNPIREQLGPRRALDYGSLDAWRGVACLAVVFFHCWLEMGLRVGRENRPTAFAWSQFGFLGVQIFFVISGFCIAVAAHSSWHKRSWGKFVWARVTRIYPPLWGALLLVVVLKEIGGHLGATAVKDEGPSSGALFYLANISLLNPLLGQSFLLRVAWSLCYEVAFYVIVFVALVASLRAKSANWMLNALHILSLGILAWLVATFQGVPPPRFPLDLWPQFGTGILVFDLLLARTQKEEKRERLLWAIGFGFATLGGVFLVRCGVSSFPVVRVHILPFSVSFGFAVLLWLAYRFEDSVSRWNFVKFLRSIGTFSYSIYLVHFTLIMALSRGLFSRVQFLPWFVEVAVQVVFSVGSGWIFYQVVEKPSQKLKRVRK